MPTATAELIRDEIAEANPSLPRSRPLPDPSEVPEMYGRVGLRPVQSCDYDRDDSGRICGSCVLTALCIDRDSSFWSRVPSFNFDEQRCKTLGISRVRHGGVIDGFDGDRPSVLHDDNPDYMDGHAWGAAAWKACQAAGLTGDPTSVIDSPAVGSDLHDLDGEIS